MELRSQTRTLLGKKSRSLRRQGFIPGEIYGRGLPNKHIQVPEKEFIKVYQKAGENTVFDLELGKEKFPVIIASVNRHYLSGDILSVDFHQVKMDEAIEATVPIEFKGEAPATKLGFVVVKVLDELEVRSLPGSIPEKFEIDISKLSNADQSISVKDISSPTGVKILNSPEMIIATVSEQEKEEELEKEIPAEEVPTETETEKKTEEEKEE